MKAVPGWMWLAHWWLSSPHTSSAACERAGAGGGSPSGRGGTAWGSVDEASSIYSFPGSRRNAKPHRKCCPAHAWKAVPAAAREEAAAPSRCGGGRSPRSPGSGPGMRASRRPARWRPPPPAGGAARPGSAGGQRRDTGTVLMRKNAGRDDVPVLDVRSYPAALPTQSLVGRPPLCLWS